MNIILELQKGTLRLTINGEATVIKVKSNFYASSEKTRAFQMFTDKETNSKIKKIVNAHRNKLKFIDKLKYILLRNTAFLVIHKDVQQLLTPNLIQAYSTLALDAREVFILRRADDFSVMTSIEEMKQASLKIQSRDADTPISKLP